VVDAAGCALAVETSGLDHLGTRVLSDAIGQPHRPLAYRHDFGRFFLYDV
jgi:hypothetical protein